ncbi:MAG: alkaline phosphatase family protein [Phycisphaerales bacterium]|nr:alkaline phosphatase family protein [Phycisphaerales bacterium]
MQRIFSFFVVAALCFAGFADPPVLEPGPAEAPSPAPVEARYNFVFVVSVDGLLPGLVAEHGADALPNFARLESGASTHNARTDPDYTLTLPNHTSMITGRPVKGPHGHLWTANTDPPPLATLQSHAGREIVSIFDVAHEHGVSTALYYGKSKFSLWVKSFNGGDDEQDLTITRAARCASIEEVTSRAVETLREWDRGLVFLHYADTDLVGHRSGWDRAVGSPYMQTVQSIDAQLGRLLAAVDGDEAHCGRTAVILTTDHGGGAPFKTHLDETKAANYTIPFVVWLGDQAQRVDLYEINAETRRDPGSGRPGSAEDKAARRLQPIRNGDAGNLALALLGLPPAPGSTINAQQDLRVQPGSK